MPEYLKPGGRLHEEITEIIDELAEMISEEDTEVGALNVWECEFIEDMTHRVAITAKQADKVSEIHNKVRS